MTFAVQVGKSGQTLAVARRVQTGAKDAHGVPVERIDAIVAGIACIAEEVTGREVLTPTGERVIGDWDIYLIADPGILPRDILTLTGPNQSAPRVLAAINHPNSNALGRIKVWELTAQSGGRP